jgi:predicted outer membrane protein
MRILTTSAILLLLTVPALAQDQLTSPYRQQADKGLRGLDEKEIADLKAGAGMRLARAAELNSYPGPRHVLDAIEAGKLTASPEQRERVQEVFKGMNRDAVRVGAQILDEEQRLETGFRTATMTESDLHSRVARIAALQGELRTIHLAAHLMTRAILSESQIARYNELRGYTGGSPHHH